MDNPANNLERYEFYSKDLQSPKHFIQWAFYYTITSALSRRVWLGSSGYEIFPNLYLCYMGLPGSGKSLSARTDRVILSKIQKPSKTDPDKTISLIYVFPQSATFEGMLTYMQKSRIFEKRFGKNFIFNPVSFIMDEEMSSLFRRNDEDISNFLTAGYNCGEYVRPTKHQGIYRIEYPCMNFIGCCTKKWLTRAIANGLIDTGLASRFIFLFGEAPEPKSFFIEHSNEQLQAIAKVKEHLYNLAQIPPQPLIVSPELKEWLNDYNKTLIAPINTNEAILEFYTRLKLHTTKLAIALHFSDQYTDFTMTKEDFVKARKILKETVEVDLHKVFESTGKNDEAALANEIIAYLSSSVDKEEYTTKDIYVKFYENYPADKIDKALIYLKDIGLIVQTGKNYKIKD